MAAQGPSTKLAGLGRRFAFSELAAKKGLRGRADAQSIALSRGGTSLAVRGFPQGQRSEQAEDGKRDVVRAAAFPSQFDQLATSQFDAFVFQGGNYLGVAHEPP